MVVDNVPMGRARGSRRGMRLTFCSPLADMVDCEIQLNDRCQLLHSRLGVRVGLPTGKLAVLERYNKVLSNHT